MFGSFLYYARAVDNTIHLAVNEISSTQTKPTQNTKDATITLLNYLATNPNTKIRFHKSNMQLHLDSDAAYLVAPTAKSRIGVYFYLRDTYTPSPKIPTPKLSEPVHI